VYEFSRAVDCGACGLEPAGAHDLYKLELGDDLVVGTHGTSLSSERQVRATEASLRHQQATSASAGRGFTSCDARRGAHLQLSASPRRGPANMVQRDIPLSRRGFGDWPASSLYERGNDTHTHDRPGESRGLWTLPHAPIPSPTAST
jgi:hypothetical protein